MYLSCVISSQHQYGVPGGENEMKMALDVIILFVLKKFENICEDTEVKS